MMMKAPKSETMIVTPAVADEWLHTSMYARQRRRADWHIGRLAIEMEKGRFMAGTQIHFGLLAGRRKCVNGQHKHGLKAAFRRAPVVAVGLATMRAQEEKAKAFWGGAAQQDGLTRFDPRSALNDFLRGNTSGHGDPIRYIRHVAGAWNKFYENGELQFLRPGDAGKIGVTIKGTRFKAWRRRVRPTDPDNGEEESDFITPVQGVLGEARL